MEKINASDFKSKCLAILDEIQRTGRVMVILKRGKPVAEIRPVAHNGFKYPQLGLKGSVKVVGDIVSPVITQAEVDLEEGKI